MITLRMTTALAGALMVAALAPVAGSVAAEGGARLYQENCARCHGVNLEGQPDWRSPTPDGTLPAPPHDATGHTWHHGDRLLFDYTKFGGEAALAERGVTGVKSAMPGFADVLTDAEIDAILAFIKSSWGDRERAYQSRVSAQE